MPTDNILFGKTPTRRDFIAVATPKAFLSVFEPWIHSCISASRQSMGDNWRESFLTMPIWRFWLGADLCGSAALGAIMPSMDGVGRYFPLTFAVLAQWQEEFAPPEIDPRGAWFEAVETYLLTTLETKDHAVLLRDLANVPHPSADTSADHNGARSIAEGGAGHIAAPGLDFTSAFSNARLAAPARAAAASTFWWTLGGEGFEACALSCLRMPSPHLFSAMLTGEFA